MTFGPKFTNLHSSPKERQLQKSICSQGDVKCKNQGRLWLAYTELQGNFYMLQLIYVDSRHFTQSYQVRIWACSGTTSHWKGSWAFID